MNMKRCILVSVMLSAALAVEAKAQSTPPAGKDAVPQPSTSGQTQLTITGCLRSDDSSTAAGTSGAGATDASRATGAGGGFVLVDAQTATSPKRGGSAAAAAKPDTGAERNLTSFRLEGRESDLRKYRNSAVEVSGTLAGTKSAGAAGSATAGATGQAGPTGSGAAATGTAPESRNVPTLRVTSVRQVSPTCTGR